MTATEEDVSRAAVDNSTWDGNAAMSNANTAADYRAICAGRKGGDPALRSSWALPHHKVPGSPPNAAGVRNALARLPQTQGLTNRAEAQRHLEGHMASISSERSLADPPRQIVRALAELELNEDESDGFLGTLTGRLAVFNEWIEVDSVFEGHFMERVAPGAFLRTIEHDRERYRAIYEHGKDQQIQRKPLGPIRTLREDSGGAVYEVALLDTDYNRALLPGLKAGLYGSSFRGGVERQIVERDVSPSNANPDGLPERTITEVSLLDFGPCPFPSYLGTTTAARSLTDEFIFSQLEEGEGLRRFAEWAEQAKPIEVTTGTEEKPPEEKPPPDVERKETEVESIDRFATVDLLIARDDELDQRAKFLHAEYAGKTFPTDVQTEWDDLRAEREQIAERVQHLREREAYVSRQAEKPQNVEKAVPIDRGKTFEVKQDRELPENIYDLSAYRNVARSQDHERFLYRDGAMRALEQNTLAFDRRKVRHDLVQDHVSGLLDHEDRSTAYLAQRMLATGSRTYSDAFWKKAAGDHLSDQEDRALAQAQKIERAFSLGTTGIPVPFVLDPTLIPVSNGTVNPWRAIARIVTITGANEWRGTTSGAITAAYVAEGTEATDNTPTLTQPVIPAVRAQAFVPFSIEVGADWGALESEMATLLADAKDDLEAGSTGFFGGNGTNQPTGLNALPVAADTLTAAVGTFAVGDLFLLENALAPRYRSRARMVGNRQQYGRVRQFSIGDNIWVPISQGLNNEVPTPGRLGQDLLGYPTYEASQMVTTVTAGSRVLLLGDFNYYVIVDRIGMNIEVIPHLFGATSRFPTGQRGLYAIWRNGGEPVDLTNGAGFKFLKVRQT